MEKALINYWSSIIRSVNPSFWCLAGRNRRLLLSKCNRGSGRKRLQDRQHFSFTLNPTKWHLHGTNSSSRNFEVSCCWWFCSCKWEEYSCFCQTLNRKWNLGHNPGKMLGKALWLLRGNHWYHFWQFLGGLPHEVLHAFSGAPAIYKSIPSMKA